MFKAVYTIGNSSDVFVALVAARLVNLFFENESRNIDFFFLNILLIFLLLCFSELVAFF